MKQSERDGMLNRFANSLLAVVMFAVLSAAVQANTAGDYVPGELVCKMKPGGVIDSVNQIYGTTTKQVLSETGSYLLGVSGSQNLDSLVTAILTRSDVFYCSLNYLLDAPEAVQSSQPFIDLSRGSTMLSQEAANTLNLSTVHALATGASVTVGVIDVGVNLTHPALASSVASGFDFISNSPIAQDVPGGKSSGHGTFIA